MPSLIMIIVTDTLGNRVVASRPCPEMETQQRSVCFWWGENAEEEWADKFAHSSVFTGAI